MLLILTSTVNVNSVFTKLLDPSEREQQYLRSFVYYITESNFSEIVICDNSGFDYSCYKLFELGRTLNKKVEILFFFGNAEKIQEKGKGYGEGEIIEYVINNSTLVRSNPGFVKITGRVIVPNINKLIKSIKINKPFFLLIHKKIFFPQKGYYTTLYYCSFNFFKAVLLNSYRNVNDYHNKYLEHCYYDAITNAKVKPYVFSRYPKFDGVSGSSNKTYKLVWYKYFICNFRNYIQYTYNKIIDFIFK